MAVDKAVPALDVGAGDGSRLLKMSPDGTGERRQQVVPQRAFVSPDAGQNLVVGVAAGERASDGVHRVGSVFPAQGQSSPR